MSAINAIVAFLQYISSGDPNLEPPPVGPTHWGLIGVCVFGSLIVAFGIILESWPPKGCKAKIALWSVVVGVVLEAAFTILLLVFDERISSAQQSKIIALETKLAPRVLTEEQQNALVAIAKQFSPQSYVLSVAVGSESAALLCVLDADLQKAGWTRHAPIDFLHTKPCGDGNTDWEAGVNVASAVHFRNTKDASTSARSVALALAKALVGDDIEAHAEVDPNNTADATTVRVMVGAKL